MSKKFIFAILLIIFDNLIIYSIDSVSLKPLPKDVVLNAQVIMENLYVTIENDKSYYYKHDNVICYQLSANKREILFQVYDERFSPKYPIYLLSGNNGTVINLGLINTNWLATSNLSHIISDCIVPEDRMLEIEIKTIPAMENVFRIPWKTQQQNFLDYFGVDGIGFYYHFSLSDSNDYDFKVTAKGYKKDYGCGYINIGERTFVEEVGK